MHAISTATALAQPSFQALQGVRILSLALNLPGPAALMRCRQMGAHCTKLEPIAVPGDTSADPMRTYSTAAYAQLHEGITVLQANLKTEQGQALLQAQLAQTDVLLTSFRPAALRKLGMDWQALHQQHPRLGMVRIFGSTDPHECEHAGHDLTYQAQAGLVQNGNMPPSLLADMTGAIMASEAVMQCLLLRAQSGSGHCLDVGLAQAAHWLAMPRDWRMTTPDGDVGGAHAGYRTYRCKDGWVALAALEPHFAQRICIASGISINDANHMRNSSVHQAIGQWMAGHTCTEISTMAGQSDIPLQVIPAQYK